MDATAEIRRRGLTVRLLGVAVLLGVLALSVLGAAGPASAGAAPLHLSSAVPIDGKFHLIDQVSCAKGFCAAIDSKGYVLTSAAPGTRHMWSREKLAINVANDPLTTVSCASASLCLVGDEAGNVFTSVDPVGTHATWTRHRISSTSINTVSCPLVTFCMAADNAGRVFTSTDPRGEARAKWKSTQTFPHGGRADPLAADCVGTQMCVFGDEIGYEFTNSLGRPGGSVGWTSQDVAGSFAAGTDNSISGVSCPTTHLCVAVDDVGDAIISTDPSDGAAAHWQTTNVLGPASDNFDQSFAGIDCPTTSLCVGVGSHGQSNEVAATGDPAAGPAAHWITYPITAPHSAVVSISCPTAHLCLAVGEAGHAVLIRF
jgi:hypothetical protein